AIDFQAGIGWQPIRHRIADLVTHVRQKLDGSFGLKLATPIHSDLCGAMTAFRLPAHDPQEVRKALWDRYRIEAPIMDRPEGNLIRVSTHFYNTHEEIDRLVEALPQLLSIR